MKDTIKTIENLIDEQNVSFIGSVDEDGYPNMKAMLSPRKREGIRVFYFTTKASSMRVKQYKSNSQACIYFLGKGSPMGVMLIGSMEVLDDKEHKEMIWRKGDTVYYPQGVTDPDYCVLRFTAKKGRFFGDSGSEDFEIM